MIAKGWRWMLGAAAAYNLLVGVPGLLAGGAVADRVIALFVTCYGLIYAMVAAAPQRLAPVLWTGVAGKIGVVALMLPEVLAGRALPGTGAILAGDALFTLAFIAFLLGPARRANPA
ncbi:hypothetical protein [Novosphingobium sp.]|uniref:hypothetical protein n=1 Tax=Novosphingobium sp. TaxID=1874826 RepID=UPI0035B0F868